MKVAAIILAAGASTRLGEPKQLVTLGGERLLVRAVRIAKQAGCSPVVVVLGANAVDILEKCARLESADVVVNPNWAEGMASSIRCGVQRLGDTVDAAILMTCDQPAVTGKHLQRLIELCTDTPVASLYAGRRGVPACFPTADFLELSLLAGEEGARRLLQSARAIELIGGELDIDTPQTLALAKSIYG